MIRVVSLNDKHKIDHGAVEGQIKIGGKTLCGIVFQGMEFFIRGSHAFDGKQGFYCKRCCKALDKHKT